MRWGGVSEGLPLLRRRLWRFYWSSASRYPSSKAMGSFQYVGASSSRVIAESSPSSSSVRAPSSTTYIHCAILADEFLGKLSVCSSHQLVPSSVASSTTSGLFDVLIGAPNLHCVADSSRYANPSTSVSLEVVVSRLNYCFTYPEPLPCLSISKGSRMILRNVCPPYYSLPQASWYYTPTRFVLIVGQERQKKYFFIIASFRRKFPMDGKKLLFLCSSFFVMLRIP